MNVLDLVPPPATPSGPRPRCADCQWHHALDVRYERLGAGQCLAQRWPHVLAIITAREAECGWPHLFLARKESA